jgi:hypothetical protein
MLRLSTKETQYLNLLNKSGEELSTGGHAYNPSYVGG